MFYHDSTGIDPTGGNMDLIPSDTWLPFKILEAEDKKTKTGRDMLKLKCEVIDDPHWKGKWVWHTVVFIPKGEKGEGMSVHFRKCIGMPYGGNDLIDGIKWSGCKFRGKVIVDEYNGQKNNKINAISPYKDEPEASEINNVEEDIGF